MIFRKNIADVILLGLLVLALLISPCLSPLISASSPPLLINEVDADTPGYDTLEFIELYDGGAGNTALDGLVVVLYNGSSDTSYDAFDLDGYSTDAEGYFVIGTVTGADIYVDPGSYGWLQNGADAVAVYTGDAADFPDGTAPATDNLVDAIVYDTNDDDDAGLLVLLNAGQSQVNEDGAGDKNNHSNQRCPNGEGGARNTNTYTQFNSTPDAENCTVPDNPPTVASTTPANSATGVALSGDISINFSEDVTVSGAWFSINCADSGVHSAAVGGGPQNYVLNPDVDFGANELCTVNVYAAQVADQDGTADNMAADYVFSFTTSAPSSACGDPATFIHDIQGSGMSSPEDGNVHTIEGVVVGDFQTSDYLRGFFLQEEDADADADPTTSEGIFVYDGSSPAVDVNVGDVVRVEGKVKEQYDLTELTYVSVEICPPGGAASAATVNLPVASVNDWEWYEGMLINIPQTLYATDNFNQGRYGEVDLSIGHRLDTPTNVVAPGAPALALQDLNDRSRVQLEDGSTVQNPSPAPYMGLSNTLRAGDTIPELSGVLHYAYGAYEVHPTVAVNFTRINARDAIPPAVGGTLKVADFNVLNYFVTLDDSGPICGPASDQDCRGADTAAEFSRQRDKIIDAIVTMDADVIGLVEIENHPTDAAIQDLTSGLNAVAGIGTYAFVNSGTIGTDVIKVAFIYKPGTVTLVGSSAVLDSSVDPLFIDTKNRPALAQTFQQTATGEKFTAVVNHLKSKGSACDDVGDPDMGDGQGNCNQTRTDAATALVNWLATAPTGSGDDDFLIMGDLNAYAMEDPISVIESAGYTNLVETFVGADAYSYVYYGQAGYLDHALANTSLTGQVTGVVEWHINADEPAALDYNDYNQPSLYNADRYRSSDHDPVIVGLNLASPLVSRICLPIVLKSSP